MSRLRMTITLEYEAEKHWYDTNDPQEMAGQDEMNVMESKVMLSEFIHDILEENSSSFSVSCMPVLSKGDNNV